MSLYISYVMVFICSICTVISPPEVLPSQSLELSNFILASTVYPHVLLWNPLPHFQQILLDFNCPHEHCRGKMIECPIKWNTGTNAGYAPRIIHDIEHMVLLVSAVYTCSTNEHEIVATDPRLLAHFPEQEFIPFILFH